MLTEEERAARRRLAASTGGKAAHAKGVAHKFKKGSELARAAGRKAGAIHAAKMAARKAAISEQAKDSGDGAHERA